VVRNWCVNVNIVYRNLKSENSQDYAQKPQRKGTIMNSASGVRIGKGKEKTANSEDWKIEKGGKEK
jgi:hypothetical protein